jgi:hypothetical protein
MAYNVRRLLAFSKSLATLPNRSRSGIVLELELVLDFSFEDRGGRFYLELVHRSLFQGVLGGYPMVTFGFFRVLIIIYFG